MAVNARDREDQLERSQEFWELFDAERARVLRKRVRWFCLAMLIIMVMSIGGNATDIVNPYYNDGTLKRGTVFDALSDGGLLTIFVSGLVYVVVRKPDRRRLVFALTLIVLAATPLASVLEVLSLMVDEPVSRGGSMPEDDPTHLPITAMGNVLLVQVLSCLIVPMPLRESLRFVIPGWLVFIATMHGVVGLDLPRTAFWAAWAAVCMAAGPLWSAWRFREMDERFQARETAEQFREVASELAYARRIHEALFPPEITEGPVRIGYEYDPMREVGGDFLFVWPLAFPNSPRPTRVSVVLIDVTGHGVPAALAVNRLHGELRAFYAARPDGSPGELMVNLNRFTYEQLSGQSIYATALCLRVDAAAGSVEYASAGHPPAMVRRADGSVTDLEPTATMLGVLPPEMFEGASPTTPLAHGDEIIAYTDGLFETADGEGKILGLDRVRELVGRATPPAGLLKAAAAWRHGRQRDDILVVSVALGSSGPA